MDNDEQSLRLREIIKERSFSQGEMKTLASGRSSNFYFNMKMTMSDPEALNLIADLLTRKIEEGPCDFVGGLEMGAVPLVNAVTMRSHQLGRPLPLFWVRKQAKDHGTKSLVEGQNMDDLAGKTAVMLEDVTTTGGSVLNAIQSARQAGIVVSRVITVIDRQEGAAENLQQESISLHSLFNAGDFG